MSIDHGKVLTKLLELASQLERNANIDFNNPHFTQGRREAYRDSAKQIRALAQPTEAVESPYFENEAALINFLDGLTELDGEGGDGHLKWRPAQDAIAGIRARADAAQGAVARVARRSDPDQGTYLVAEWLGPLPEPGELLYTHPQAAPALMSSQDDWTVLDCPHCGKCVTYSKKAASSKDAYRDLTQEVESLRERLGQAAPAQGAVADVPRWDFERHADGQSLKLYPMRVADGRWVKWSDIQNRAFFEALVRSKEGTHPQAAPAQGDGKDCTCQRYDGRDCRKCFDPPYPDGNNPPPLWGTKHWQGSILQMVGEMRNFADVADRCELTEGNAPAVIRLWADRLAAAPSQEVG